MVVIADYPLKLRVFPLRFSSTYSSKEDTRLKHSLRKKCWVFNRFLYAALGITIDQVTLCHFKSVFYNQQATDIKTKQKYIL